MSTKRHTARGHRAYTLLTTLAFTIITPITAFCNLPTPPAYEYSSNGDWLSVAESVSDKSVNIFLGFMGIALIIVVFSGWLRGYQAAQERQEMSHFFKALGVGFICLALGFGLLYGAHLIISSQGG